MDVPKICIIVFRLKIWIAYSKFNFMSPTILREKGYRFYFLSNEEKRVHIHVTCEDGEAKFCLEPIISLAVYHGLDARKLNEIHKIVKVHENEIIKAWQKHFSKH